MEFGKTSYTYEESDAIFVENRRGNESRVPSEGAPEIVQVEAFGHAVADGLGAQGRIRLLAQQNVMAALRAATSAARQQVDAEDKQFGMAGRSVELIAENLLEDYLQAAIEMVAIARGRTE